MRYLKIALILSQYSESSRDIRLSIFGRSTGCLIPWIDGHYLLHSNRGETLASGPLPFLATVLDPKFQLTWVRHE